MSNSSTFSTELVRIGILDQAESENSGRQLFDQLKERVEFLMDNDMSALFRILYRIDVPEEVARHRLHHSGDKEASTIITELILERLQRTIESRKKYS